MEDAYAVPKPVSECLDLILCNQTKALLPTPFGHGKKSSTVFVNEAWNAESGWNSQFAAYLLGPLYFGEDLTENERKRVID